MGQQNELQIVFIYDCLRNTAEEDDPLDSILYFHPKEISYEKRMAICGQLMGVTQFLNETFSSPTIITLQNGKFSIRPIDSRRQYLLALGCSSGTPDWLLQKQASLLQQLLLFFHGGSLELILSESKRSTAGGGVVVAGSTTTTSDHDDSKLSTMIQHYISLSQCNGDLFALTFGILPMLHLPKSANTIPLQATILLQTCMMKKNVLGGIIMYQTKVIGVEMGQHIAQKLALIQPYKTPPAEPVPLDFKLPFGVQLLFIYITQQDLSSLNENYSRFQTESMARGSSSMVNRLNKNLKNEIQPIQEESLEHSLSSFDAEKNLEEEVNRIGSLENSKLATDSEDEEFKNQKPTKARKVSDVPVYRKSLEDISSIAVHSLKPNPLVRSSTIADPLYPYIFPNGKCLTYALVNSFNDELLNDENMKEEDDCDDGEEEEFHSVKSNSSIKDSGTVQSDEPTDRSSVSGATAATTNVSTDLKCNSIEKGGSNQEKLAGESATNYNHSTETGEVMEEEAIQSNIRRPADLPLLASKTVGGALRKKQRFWKTFDDVLSPNEYLTNGTNNNEGEILTRTQVADPLQTVINESEHQRLLNSFRKLGSHEDEREDESQLDEKESSTTSTSSASNANLSYDRDQSGQCASIHRKVGSSEEGTSQLNPENEKFEQEILFMYHVGPMRLFLVLDGKEKLDCDFINSLCEYGSSTLTDLKDALNNVIEDPSIQFSTQTNPYCFLSYDSVWKSLTHGGRNETMDFSTVQQMHQDFTICPQIHELVLRGEDRAIYGYQCVGSEVYYQQSSGSNLQPGVPMPGDLLGKVPAKAKRRLDRDHSILIL